MKLIRVKPRHRNVILSVLVVANVIVAILVWQLLNPHLAIPAVAAALYGSYTLWTILFNERRMERHKREIHDTIERAFSQSDGEIKRDPYDDRYERNEK